MKSFLSKKVLLNSVVVFLVGEFFWDFYDNCSECFQNFHYVTDIVKGLIKGVLFYFLLEALIKLRRKYSKKSTEED